MENVFSQGAIHLGVFVIFLSLSKMSKKSPKMSIIELSQLGQYLFDFSDLKCLQTKLNYIDKFKLYEISHLT